MIFESIAVEVWIGTKDVGRGGEMYVPGSAGWIT